MNKGLIGLILGIIAVLGGAFVATILIKNKLSKKDDYDYDEYDPFDDPVDDDEFEHFFENDDDESEVTDSFDEEEEEDEDEEKL